MTTTTDAERPASTTLSRLPSLTGLRWLAALLVFVFHLGYVGGSTGSATLHVSGRAGHLGVSFFFILSGFVLTYSARPTDTPPKFWRRRLAKIFPNHWATFVVAALLLTWAGETISRGDALANLFLVHTWVPRLSSWISVNPVSWSLSCELLFYLAFPLLLRLVRRVPEGRLWLAAGVIAFGIVLVPLLVQALVPSTPRIPYATFGPVSYQQLWLVYFFPPLRVPELVLGIVLARVVLSGRWVRVGFVPALLLVVAGQVFGLSASSYSYLLSISAVPALPVGLLIGTAAVADVRGLRSPFRSRSMVRLGELSFAFYMVHKTVLGYLPRWYPGGVPAWDARWPVSRWLVFAVLSFAVALCSAELLYRFVEVPCLRRFGSSRRGRPASRR